MQKRCRLGSSSAATNSVATAELNTVDSDDDWLAAVLLAESDENSEQLLLFLNNNFPIVKISTFIYGYSGGRQTTLSYKYKRCA